MLHAHHVPDPAPEPYPAPYPPIEPEPDPPPFPMPDTPKDPGMRGRLHYHARISLKPARLRGRARGVRWVRRLPSAILTRGRALI